MILSVVIPAYNEENGVGETIRQLLLAKKEIVGLNGIDGMEVLVVDDGSTDNTRSVVLQYEEVILISHEENRGYGASLKTGFARSSGDIIGYLDADGTYPPGSFPGLLSAMFSTKYDMVIGSRMAGERSEMHLLRDMGNRFFSRLLSFMSGQRITDVNSGMRLIKRSVLDKLGQTPDGLDFTIALSTIVMLHQDMQVQEVAIPYDERIGRSKLHVVTDGLRFLRTLLRVVFQHRMHRKDL